MSTSWGFLPSIGPSPHPQNPRAFVVTLRNQLLIQRRGGQGVPRPKAACAPEVKSLWDCLWEGLWGPPGLSATGAPGLGRNVSALCGWSNNSASSQTRARSQRGGLGLGVGSVWSGLKLGVGGAGVGGSTGWSLRQPRSQCPVESGRTGRLYVMPSLPAHACPGVQLAGQS